MKKLLSALCAVGLLSCAVVNAEQKTNFDGFWNVGVENLLSKYKDGKVLFVRNDSTFVADIDEKGVLSNVVYTNDLQRINFDGQVSYGEKTGTLYYSCAGKIFTAKQKRNGKWVEDQYIDIPGTGVQRDKYKGSVLAYANWRYLPNDSVVVMNPTINEDETEIYFASNMVGSEGLDIWKSTKMADGVWSAPEKLGSSVNSKSDENYPFLRKDGTLAFASNRNVGNRESQEDRYDVYASRRQGTRLSQSMADLYEQERVMALRLAYKKRVADSMRAEIDRVNQLAKEEVSDSSALNGTSPTESQSVASNDAEKGTEDQISAPLSTPQAIEREKKIEKALAAKPDSVIQVSKNVLATKEMRIFYFEFDKGIPNGSYKEDLEVVLDFINAYPESKFLIVGHTDERGSDEYNMALSEKRAEWVFFNLLVKGVKLDRMQTKGEGERHPLIKNAQTEEGHQKNRRVEIHKLN